MKGKTGVVDIGILNDNYEAQDTVNIVNLKKRNLISTDCIRVHVSANGTINKALTVVANSFDPEAISAITAEGGDIVMAYRLVDKKNMGSDTISTQAGGTQNA